MKLMNVLSGFFRGHTVSCLPETAVPDGPVGKMKPASLADMVSGPSTGWAVERDGILQVQTVSDNRTGAMVYGLQAAGFLVMGVCEKKGCDCFDRSFKEALPDARVVEVDVMVRGNCREKRK